MSVLVTGYDRFAVRVGVSRHLGRFRLSRWEFGRFSFGAIGCSVAARRLGSRPLRQTFAWSDVAGAERTRSGIRFRFRDRADTMDVGLLTTSERELLLDAARMYCPAGTYDDEIHHHGREASAA